MSSETLRVGTLPNWMIELLAQVDFDELEQELVANARAEYFQLGAGQPEFETALRGGAHENLALVQAVLRGEITVEEINPVRPVELAALAARLAISAVDMQKAYRAGIDRVTQVCMEAVRNHIEAMNRDDPSALPAAEVLDAVVAFSTLMAELHRRLVETVANTHAHEEAVRNASREQLRQKAVQDLLEGGEVPPGTDLFQLLRYDVSANHVGILFPESGAAVAKSALHELRRAVDYSNAFVLPMGSDCTMVWVARERAWPSSWRRKVKQVLADRGDVARVGEPAAGLAGFRATYTDAKRLETIRETWGSAAPAVMTFREMRLEWLLLNDSDAASQFVRDELGELGCPGPRTESLRETLRAWLETGSHVSTGALVQLHEHTVRNRLRKVEQLIGHSLNERRTELQVALRLHSLIHRPTRSGVSE